MEAIVHKFNRNYIDHYASDCPKRVVSVVVLGKRIFLEHKSIFDGRGTHYGETEEQYTLIRDAQRCRQLESRFVEICNLDTRIVRLVFKSQSKSIIRGGSFSHNGPWREFRDGLCRGALE